MSEQYVQVPVSLIERMRFAYSNHRENDRPDFVREMLALLSQLTPTAEPTAEPPRIEDLAPGTTFSAETSDGLMCGDPSRWLVLDDGWLRMFGSAPGVTWNRASIDPSTIRDVTPPKDAA